MTNLHPAQITIRRANANRARRQVAAATQPKLQTRTDVEAAVNAAWKREFPTFRMLDSLIKFYGVVLLRQLTDRQLNEFYNRIIA